MALTTLGLGAMQAGSNLFGGLFQGLVNRANAGYQFEQEKKMWQMQNEYNLPANQMQRFKDAGLNPALMYGQGTPGNSTGTPSYNLQNPEFKHMDILGTLGAYQDMMVKREQSNNLRAQNDMIRAQIANAQVDNNIKTLDYLDKNAIYNVKTKHGKYEFDVTTDMDLKNQLLKANNLRQAVLGNQIELLKTQNSVARYNLDNILPMRPGQISAQTGASAASAGAAWQMSRVNKWDADNQEKYGLSRSAPWYVRTAGKAWQLWKKLNKKVWTGNW